MMDGQGMHDKGEKEGRNMDLLYAPLWWLLRIRPLSFGPWSLGPGALSRSPDG
jgi:hypothetical protein